MITATSTPPSADVSPQSTAQILKQTQEQLAAEIFRVIRNRGIAATWAKQLLDAFRSEMSVLGGGGSFRTTLSGMLQQGRLDGDGDFCLAKYRLHSTS